MAVIGRTVAADNYVPNACCRQQVHGSQKLHVRGRPAWEYPGFLQGSHSLAGNTPAIRLRRMWLITHLLVYLRNHTPSCAAVPRKMLQKFRRGDANENRKSKRSQRPTRYPIPGNNKCSARRRFHRSSPAAIGATKTAGNRPQRRLGSPAKSAGRHLAKRSSGCEPTP